MIGKGIVVEGGRGTGTALVGGCIGTGSTLTHAEDTGSIGWKIVGRARVVADVVENCGIVVAGCTVRGNKGTL